MLILFDVYQPAQEGEIGENLIASVDVTGNTDDEKANILANLKTFYGDGCYYTRHECGHESGKVCTESEV